MPLHFRLSPGVCFLGWWTNSLFLYQTARNQYLRWSCSVSRLIYIRYLWRVYVLLRQTKCSAFAGSALAGFDSSLFIKLVYFLPMRVKMFSARPIRWILRRLSRPFRPWHLFPRLPSLVIYVWFVFWMAYFITRSVVTWILGWMRVINNSMYASVPVEFSFTWSMDQSINF